MSALLVTYDLNKTGQNYNGLYEVLKKYPYAKLSESSYVIQTVETPHAVYNKLLPHIDKNDNIYVVTVSPPYYGQGLEQVNAWLSQWL
jgi:hypothetical protein